MANVFAGVTACVSLWRFEDGALSTDSKGSNTLNFSGTPAGTTVNFIEGNGAITFAAASSQYAYITDASLSSDFPLKNGDTSKLISVSCWVRPTTVDSNKRRIWSKWATTGSKKSLEVYYNSARIYLQYSTSGSNSTEVEIFTSAMTANQWYHVSLILDGVNKTWRSYVYNNTAGTRQVVSGTLAGTLYVSDADWRIGADGDLGANLYFDGQIDEFVVFNNCMTSYEPAGIRSGSYPVTEQFWHIDTVDGNDSNPGTTWATSRKTLKQNFYAGDSIKVARSVQTGAAGTVSTTNGSLSITTTSDLTGSISSYTIIRIDSDNTCYMVRTINSTTITLYRPYRGTTASGKSLSYYTGLPTIAAYDWSPVSMGGTEDNPIILDCGVDTSTNSIDGFTILYGNNATYLNGANWYWVQMTNMATSYWNYPWSGNAYDCTFTNCHAFRNTGMGLSCYWHRMTINGFISERGGFPSGISLYYCEINDLETGESVAIGFNQSSWVVGTNVHNWRNAGWSGYYAFQVGTHNSKLRFYNPVFDETGSGCTQVWVQTSGGIVDTCFENPTIGAGTLFGQYASWGWYGNISFSNVNGDCTDNRTYMEMGEGGKHALLTSDTSVYRTSSPSAKISFYTPTRPVVLNHYIPCDAGVSRTVSVYFRKNSSYGSYSRPTMRLHWISGTTNLVSEVYEATMSDVDDTWTQVSHTFTPGLTSTISMELVFQSSNSGAVAWYDDIDIS